MVFIYQRVLLVLCNFFYLYRVCDYLVIICCIFIIIIINFAMNLRKNNAVATKFKSIVLHFINYYYIFFFKKSISVDIYNIHLFYISIKREKICNKLRVVKLTKDKCLI